MASKLRHPIIALFSGSTCVESLLNSKLLNQAASQLESRDNVPLPLGLADADYSLPLFSQDLKTSAFPEAARRLNEDLIVAEAFLVASPEYDGFPTPKVMNAITWATSGEGNAYDAFQRKVGVVISASPGSMGGLRGLGSKRELLRTARLESAPGQPHHFTRHEADRNAQ
ncbi:MAG: hypothetical protein SGPRY_009942 [Prymnesium sp.]